MQGTLSGFPPEECIWPLKDLMLCLPWEHEPHLHLTGNKPYHRPTRGSSGMGGGSDCARDWTAFPYYHPGQLTGGHLHPSQQSATDHQ